MLFPMNEIEARARVCDWVNGKYGFVPDIASVIHWTEGLLREHELIDELEAIAELGKWFIAFKCDWDSDRAGLPTVLIVSVDEKGCVEVQS